MTCEVVTLPGGFKAIVCGPRRRKRCACGRPANLLCDWKVGGGTCDAPICASCSTSPAEGRDLCQAHAIEFERWKAERSEKP